MRPHVRGGARTAGRSAPVLIRLIAASLASATLLGCQQKAPAVSLVDPGKSAALRRMETVALAARECWFTRKDPAFRAYRLSNELGSFAGRPRILIVPARSMESRPLLVVQAEGPAGRVEAFGPLLDGNDGGRIRSDIERWALGDNACAARA